MTEGKPDCDQYRYLNIFVKKWRWIDKTPEDVQNLVNEVYGIDVSSDDLLKSILREISMTIDWCRNNEIEKKTKKIGFYVVVPKWYFIFSLLTSSSRGELRLSHSCSYKSEDYYDSMQGWTF